MAGAVKPSSGTTILFDSGNFQNEETGGDYKFDLRAPKPFRNPIPSDGYYTGRNLFLVLP